MLDICVYMCVCTSICMYVCVCVYIENLLHKDQLHVSAFYSGHLQVEIEKT